MESFKSLKQLNTIVWRTGDLKKREQGFLLYIPSTPQTPFIRKHDPIRKNTYQLTKAPKSDFGLS